jgi:hypothetical protein
MAAFIGRCRAKGCRSAVRAEAGVENVRSAASAIRFEERAAGIAAGEAVVFGNNGVVARCGEHGIYQLKALQGRVVEERSCDARCMGATGASCDCSCGGANHGINHG